jgi:hypothetical protein
MLYVPNLPKFPPMEIREILMGLHVDYIKAQGPTQNQQVHLLGQCTDLGILS